jgi:hypothetical protein
MQVIKLDFSSFSSYQIQIGDGIPDLNQINKGIIIIRNMEEPMTWKKLSVKEPHMIFEYRADLFVDDPDDFKNHVVSWEENDDSTYKKRCLFFLKGISKERDQGDISIENGDVDVLWDDSKRKITIIGDHTESVAKKYGLPPSNNGSMGSSGRQFFYEDLDQYLYNLVKTRMISDELDATWLDDEGARD